MRSQRMSERRVCERGRRLAGADEIAVTLQNNTRAELERVPVPLALTSRSFSPDVLGIWLLQP